MPSDLPEQVFVDVFVAEGVGVEGFQLESGCIHVQQHFRRLRKSP